MMWKTLLFLAMTSVVLAGKINNKRHATYAFHIKHDYDYLKRHVKLEQHKHETEKKPEEDKKGEEQLERINGEQEKANESDGLNTESEEPENNEKKKALGYEFLYKVIDPYTHDKKEQHEKRHGDEVKGVYWLLQPDGYKRTVNYHVDKHGGFQAKVDYSKPEQHTNKEDYTKPKSEYYVKTHRGHEKYIPVIEEQEEQEEQQQPQEQQEQQEIQEQQEPREQREPQEQQEPQDQPELQEQLLPQQEQEQEEQDKQEAPAEQIPIYVI